jgi:predicted DNA-binding protein
MFEQKDIKDIDNKQMQKFLLDKEVVEKGTIIVETIQDYELAMKYLEALKNGNEFYKPKGLRFEAEKRGV